MKQLPPLILEGALKIHLENYIWMFHELIGTVKDDMYVDDLGTGGENTSEVDKIKGDSVNLFQRGGFKPHKWHSNKQALETNDLVNENELNFAKQQFGTKPKEEKTIGLLWDKREDSFNIKVPNVNKNPTKRNILSTLASIYEQLGLVSPCLLLKVQPCKLYNNKYMIASTQINTEIFAFIAVLVFNLLNRKDLVINRKNNRNC